MEKVNRIIYYFDEKYPDIELTDVTAVELQQFYNDKYDDGISANTIKHYHANIHKALKYAVKINLVSVNEAEKTERPKLDKYEATFFIPERILNISLRHSEEISWNLLFTSLLITDSEEVK